MNGNPLLNHLRHARRMRMTVGQTGQNMLVGDPADVTTTVPATAALPSIVEGLALSGGSYLLWTSKHKVWATLVGILAVWDFTAAAAIFAASQASVLTGTVVAPAGSIATLNNGQVETLSQDTTIATLQMNGVTSYTTPDQQTFSVPTAPIPAGHS